jgi:hypothetical protein
MNVILSDTEFLQFRDLIHRIAGISLSDAKKQLVSARLAKRLHLFKLTNYGAYYKLLMKDSAELQVAVDMLTTNETYFFREPKHFDFLRDDGREFVGRQQPGGLDEAETVHVGHVHVTDNQVNFASIQFAQRIFAITAFDHVVTCAFERDAHHLPDGCRVVDDQNGFAHRKSSSRKR